MKKLSKFLGFALSAVMIFGFGFNFSQHSFEKASALDATMATGTNGSAATVNEKSGIKVGTSSKGGDMKVTVPSGALNLELYAAAWSGVSDLSLNITPSANITPNSISLTADSGLTGNSPFTLKGSESNYKFSFSLSNINSATTFTFTGSSSKRFGELPIVLQMLMSQRCL